MMRRIAAAAIVLAGIVLTAAHSAALSNTEDDLGFLSGFWGDWALTARLMGCDESGGRSVCKYSIRNTDGLDVMFASDKAGGKITNLTVTQTSSKDPLLFLVTSATVMKSIDPEWPQEEREAASKHLFKQSAGGGADLDSHGAAMKMTRVGDALIFEAKRRD